MSQHLQRPETDAFSDFFLYRVKSPFYRPLYERLVILSILDTHTSLNSTATGAPDVEETYTYLVTWPSYAALLLDYLKDKDQQKAPEIIRRLEMIKNKVQKHQDPEQEMENDYRVFGQVEIKSDPEFKQRFDEWIRPFVIRQIDRQLGGRGYNLTDYARDDQAHNRIAILQAIGQQAGFCHPPMTDVLSYDMFLAQLLHCIGLFKMTPSAGSTLDQEKTRVYQKAVIAILSDFQNDYSSNSWCLIL